MKQRLSVSIILPNWNGEKLLGENLPKILSAKDNLKNNICEIIVVDDGSTDSSVVLLEKEYNHQVRLIKHTKNRGFSSAVNMGVRMAKGDLVCLLNTDVIPSVDFLENVIFDFESNRIAAVGLHERGFGPAVGKFKNGYISHSGGCEVRKKMISFWASGGSSVWRRSVWMELKGFDEELFNPFYWEDVDLGYRAWKHGYQIIWEPSANVIHKHESVINTSNFRKRKLMLIKERNQLLMTWKNLTSRGLWKKHLNFLIKRVLREPGYILVVLLAFAKIKMLRKKRNVEIKESTVSDEAIFGFFEKY
ncbi:hypothetical protein A2382_00520 [Candidatus Woesebacteria bacterium RIFOXYB1_FULL_38_16]|uniref:Glycosyltransferase 2-like domain-containing protein n=1 Tax=Candidatus Woesebacteria bacterium RIFOXYB1_FULL_38_16 TaxID=1802538 RepID=A0A1F8CSF6_9BACT|nr:MAG: hypothetical protein A2191_01400 [Candidatus Woesebacteria bacterium RIFOXYA1_FULL_38_9]OGM79254.1 MAG: hypothetical protein A2382_00520 [Candidatus Woesebacteria bacterium RIFOXYB1_FULL_38_16]